MKYFMADDEPTKQDKLLDVKDLDVNDEEDEGEEEEEEDEDDVKSVQVSMTLIVPNNVKIVELRKAIQDVVGELMDVKDVEEIDVDEED